MPENVSLELKKLRSVIEEKTKRREELLKEINKLEIEINALMAFGNFPSESNISTPLIDDKASWLLDEGTTLRIISKSKDPNGLGIQDIKKSYIEAGFNCHDRHVDKHLKKLLDTKKIVQTNPGINKGKRFRAISNL